MNILSIIGIPLLGAGLFFSRIAFGRRINNSWKIGLITFFALNVICFINLGLRSARDFNVQRELSMNSTPAAVFSDTLTIDFSDNPYEGIWFTIGPEIRLDKDQIILSSIELHLEKTTLDHFTIEQIHSSRGRTIEEARALATAINYAPEIIGQQLNLPSYFNLEKGEKWRDQLVKIKIGIPEGKTIQLDRELRRHIYQISWNSDLDHPWNATECDALVMGPNGLECPDWLAKVNSKKEILPKEFNRLRVQGRVNVDIVQGSEYKVTMIGRSDEFKHVTVNTGGDLLDIHAEERIRHAPKLIIETPNLDFIELESEGTNTITGFNQDQMSLSIRSYATMTATVDINQLIIKQDEHSKLVLRGKGTELILEMEGQSELDAAGYTVNKAIVKAKDGSRANLHVLEEFEQHEEAEHYGEIRVQGLREVSH